MMKLICLDAEFADSREILELAIYDYEGEQLYRSFFRPVTLRQWKSSEKIHHITPAMVKDKPSFEKCRDDVQRIIDSADYIVGFAVDNDIRMLERSGIETNDACRIVDVRDIYWHCVARGNGIGLNNVPGLSSCASSLGIQFGDGEEHSAAGDTVVTLSCLKTLMASDPEAETDPEGVLKRLIEATDRDKKEFRRENARGYIHLLKGPKGYSIKPSTNEHLTRTDVVATISVEHRDRAEVDLLNHFSKKAIRGEHRIFALRDRDINYFLNYTNTYDEDNYEIYRAYAKRY